MADGYSVGNLKLAFTTLDQTSDDFKKLATNLRAIVNLINRISTADLGKFSANVKEITKAFNPFLTKLEKSTAGLQAFDSVVRQIGVRNISNVATVIDEVRQTTEEAAEGVEEVSDTVIEGQTRAQDAVQQTTQAINEQISSTYRALTAEEQKKVAQYEADKAARKALITYYEAELAMGASGKQARQYAKELAELRKQDGQVGKKSGFAKFLGQIKRVAIYRLIRAGLKAVTSAFKDGISALAQFDSGINKTMSQLTTSFTVMKLSVSTALLPLLQSITPIIQQISVGFANMANVISASMSKTGYYTKINTDRLLAYNKAANLFDFDKFRALNKGDDAMNLLSTEKVEDLNEELGSTKYAYSAIYNVIQQISVLAGNLFETVRQIIDAIVTAPITATLLNVAQILIGIVSGVVNLVNESGLLEPIVNAILIGLTAWGAKKVISGLTTLYGKFGMLGIALSAITISLGIIGNWDNFSVGTKKAITIISGLIAAFTALAVAVMAYKSALTLGTGVALITTAAAAGAVAIKGLTSGAFSTYAQGGLPDKGSMFVAGEQGAEFVYNMPSGQSGVANIQQIAQAVYQGTYQATVDWWKSARNDIGGDIYLDGEKIYQNTTSHASKHGKKWSNV